MTITVSKEILFELEKKLLQQDIRIAEATKLIKYVLYCDEIDECFEAQRLIDWLPPEEK